MNKRGVFEVEGESLIWLFRISILLIVVVFLYVIVNAFIKIRVDTSALEQKIILDKVLTQPGCLNFYDVRWQPYSIDISKFNSNSLEQCIISKNIGIRLKLNYNDKNAQADYNDRMLGYLGFCSKSSDFYCKKDSLIVKVKDNDIIYDGILGYEVILKNE